MLTQTLPVNELEYHEAEYWSAFYQKAGLALQRKFGFAAYPLNGTVCMAAPGMDILAFNRAIGTGINFPVTRHHLKEIIEFYRICGSSRFFLQLSPPVLTSGVNELLDSAGFSYYNNWCKYHKEITGHQEVPASDLTVAQVQPHETGLFSDIIKSSFQFEYDIKNLLASTYGMPGWHYYFAKDGSRPVAAASMFIKGDHALLTLAGTLPEARNRGSQNLLIATRINKAIVSGCRYVSSETAEDTPEKPSPSSRNMQRAGFSLAYLRPNYLYQF